MYSIANQRSPKKDSLMADRRRSLNDKKLAPVKSPLLSREEQKRRISIKEEEAKKAEQQQQEASLVPPAPPIIEKEPVRESPKPAAAVTEILAPKPTPNLFEMGGGNRSAPETPPTAGIERTRAEKWATMSAAEVMHDKAARQLFRCFLHEALAEENLLFVEELEELRQEKQPDKISKGVAELLDKYGSYINLSFVVMSKLHEATKTKKPDPKALEMAYKEIYNLLENDQLPRFRRSRIYSEFMEQVQGQ